MGRSFYVEWEREENWWLLLRLLFRAINLALTRIATIFGRVYWDLEHTRSDLWYIWDDILIMS
jgi:hypothetical protein